MKKTVATIGEILWDVFPKGKKAGGSSMNVALNLHKQNISSKFISAIGNDENGNELINFLKSKDFNTELIQTNAFPTSTVVVKLDKRHQATYEIIRPVAWDNIELTGNAKLAVANADAFVYCSLTCRTEKSKETILELLKLAKLKIFDINLRLPHFNIETLKNLLAAADILKINEDEIEFLRIELELKETNIKALVKSIAELFDIKIVCLTLGAEGALVYEAQNFYTNNGYKVNVADTVGAGDAFLGTFVASHLKGFSIEEALDSACKVGAFVASQPGANPDYGEEIFN